MLYVQRSRTRRPFLPQGRQRELRRLSQRFQRRRRFPPRRPLSPHLSRWLRRTCSRRSLQRLVPVPVPASRVPLLVRNANRCLHCRRPCRCVCRRCLPSSLRAACSVLPRRGSFVPPRLRLLFASERVIIEFWLCAHPSSRSRHLFSCVFLHFLMILSMSSWSWVFPLIYFPNIFHLLIWIYSFSLYMRLLACSWHLIIIQLLLYNYCIHLLLVHSIWENKKLNDIINYLYFLYGIWISRL